MPPPLPSNKARRGGRVAAPSMSQPVASTAKPSTLTATATATAGRKKDTGKVAPTGGKIKKRKRTLSLAGKAAKTKAAAKAKRDLKAGKVPIVKKAKKKAVAEDNDHDGPQPKKVYNPKLGYGVEYEVEEVVDSKLDGEERLYKVRWVGYPEENDLTWEHSDNLANAPELVDEFEAKEPNKP